MAMIACRLEHNSVFSHVPVNKHIIIVAMKAQTSPFINYYFNQKQLLNQQELLPAWVSQTCTA